MPNTPTENSVYCLRVTEVSQSFKGTIVSLDFGKITYTGDAPDYAEEIDKKFPFLLKETSEAAENGIGIYPYGAIVVKHDTIPPTIKAKLHVIPCGNISYLPNDLMESFRNNGYLETDDEVAPIACHVGDVYTIGATETEGSGS